TPRFPQATEDGASLPRPVLAAESVSETGARSIVHNPLTRDRPSCNALWLRRGDRLKVISPKLQRMALFIKMLVSVIDAANARFDVSKHCLGDIRIDAKLRQSRAQRPAQIMVDPRRKRHLWTIATFASHFSQRVEHVYIESLLDPVADPGGLFAIRV